MVIPPTPTYKKDLKKLEAVYKKALVDITNLLVATSPEDLLRRELYESTLRQITFLIAELNQEAKGFIKATLTDAFGHAQASALVTMGLASNLVEAKGKIGASLLAQTKIEAMIADTFEDILQAHSKMSLDLKKLVRQVQAEVLRANVVMHQGTVHSAKELKKALLAQGFSKSLVDDVWVGIVDAGGRRWDLTTYTQMVARTKLQQVQIEAARVAALENDTDLAVISSHGAKDACSHFEGLIISLEGRTEGYMTLEDVRNSGLIFHPNCQHTVHPIGDIDALPRKVVDKAGKANNTAFEALSDPDKLKREDNQRRYQEKKDRKEEIKRKRKEALEKAREARMKTRSQ